VGTREPKIVANDVEITIGSKSLKGADIFTIRLVTPAGLETLGSKMGIIATRPLLIMEEYDYENLWNWMEKTLSSCEGETWLDCVAKLKNYFDWEYDDYKEF